MDNQIKTTAEAVESQALPRRHAVHTGPGTPAEAKPLPKRIAEQSFETKSAAEWAYERLILYIKNFEEQLDSSEEVAMGFTGGDAGVLRIEGLGFFDPDIVTFYGSDPSGAKTQLIQHVSQLNVLLRALPREAQTDVPPRRIGFQLAEDLDKA